MIKTKKSIARFLGEPEPLKNTIKMEKLEKRSKDLIKTKQPATMKSLLNY